MPIEFLKSLDFRVSNTCNFRCRTCTPAASSALAKDWVFISKEKNVEINRKAFESNEELRSYLSPVWSQLEKVYFAGGEPFLQVEHYLILEELIKSKRSSQVELFYNTNLSVRGFGKHDLVEYWKRFPRISLSLSIDGTYEKGAYIRDGFNWDHFKDNVKYFKENVSGLELFYNITVSNFNGLYLPEMVRHLKNELGASEGRIYFNPVSDPAYYALNNLTADLKDKVLKTLIEASTHLSSPLKERVEAVANLINRPNDIKNLKAFQQMTKRFDQVRGQSFRDVFPELSSLLK